MSAIANFLMIQFRLGNVSIEQINSLIEKKLTQEEADEITRGEK
jgi:predicted nuclease of predicted toxin-antitoxin system